MRIRTGLGVLACCAALTACTAAPKGPNTTVTTPAVGRPPTPRSAQAALSSEAFTPYAGLGAASDDGLAPGETYATLHTACMNDAGYGQYAGSTFFNDQAPGGSALTLALPFGWFGYLGTTEAAQYGFMAASQFLGPFLNLSANPYADLPAGAEAAAGKCFNVVMDFNNTQNATALAGIETMSNAISNDVVQDPNLKNATTAWSACMARNGYRSPNAQTLADQQMDALAPGPGSSPGPAPGSGLTAAQNKAQIATAVADADCTQTTDLAGIYFAVQASYEQQTVEANQQALAAAVGQYKASYARELSKLPTLLRTTSATPALLQAPARPRGPGHAGTPSPTHS
jgi:hypothetical protein